MRFFSGLIHTICVFVCLVVTRIVFHLPSFVHGLYGVSWFLVLCVCSERSMCLLALPIILCLCICVGFLCHASLSVKMLYLVSFMRSYLGYRVYCCFQIRFFVVVLVLCF